MRAKKRKADKFVQYTFTLPPKTLAALKAIHARTGIPVSTQIRFGIDHWLKQQRRTPQEGR